ncbi:hypothetical protein D9M68_967350 [compost metagenome]
MKLFQLKKQQLYHLGFEKHSFEQALPVAAYDLVDDPVHRLADQGIGRVQNA